MIRIRCLLLLLFPLIVCAQEPLRVEQIFTDARLQSRGAGSFRFLKDGRHFTRLDQRAVTRYDLVTGKAVETIFDGRDTLVIQTYGFSSDERFLLIEFDRQSVYRHSYMTRCRVWDRQGKKAYEIAGGERVMLPSFSPDGRQVAFVRHNDLYVQDVLSGREVRITGDGQPNAIINGAADWVYEEEFALKQAYVWSPDGTRIAFLRFDETEVPEFTLDLYEDQLYPQRVSYKYPKVGEHNARVTAMVCDLASGTVQTLETGGDGVPAEYLPRIRWTRDPSLVCVYRMNRQQNILELWEHDVRNGHARILLKERADLFLELTDDLYFLENGKHFVWSSDQYGYRHLYLYDMEGKLVRPLTRGPWEVTGFYGVDEARGTVYFQAAKTSPLRREVYAVPLTGGDPVALLDAEGCHSALFSPTYDYLVATHSTLNTPEVHTVVGRDGTRLRTIEDNAVLAAAQQRHGVQPLVFFSFPAPDGTELHGWMIRPAGFSPDSLYPVLMYAYGGPHSQEVQDAWRGKHYWWFQMLAGQGFLIVCVDNRGTDARGAAFRNATYRQLGHYETLDQIAAARYIGALPWVDASRIGMFGWSYGGFLSTLCLLKGAEVFKAAIAVAPVTNWKWYDSIYTERYMQTEKDNPAGYRENSPVYFADRLKGAYLLAHGMADDNVHFQHAVEMSDALIRANKAFDMAFYPNRDHGIRGGMTRIHLFNRMTSFLHEHLGR